MIKGEIVEIIGTEEEKIFISSAFGRANILDKDTLNIERIHEGDIESTGRSISELEVKMLMVQYHAKKVAECKEELAAAEKALDRAVASLAEASNK